MLQISREQLKMFEQVQRDAFLDGCLRVLQLDRPGAAMSGPAMPEWVRQCVDQLAGLGFTCSGDCRYAARLVFKYQQETHRGPLPQAIMETLQSANATIEKKIEALEQLFVFGDPPEPTPVDPGLNDC